MKINDILFEGPQIGDRFELELGDLLIETVVEDVTEDGVVIKLDETGLKLVVDSYKQKMLVESLNEMDKSAPQPGRDGKVSHGTYGTRDEKDSDYFKGKESPAKAITAKQAEKDALEILKKQGVAEGSGDKVHLKTPKHGLADHPGRNTGVGLRTFAQTPEQDRCPKCNSLFKNHYKQGVAEGSEQDDPYRGTTPPQGKKAARNAHRLGKTYTNPHSPKYHKKDHAAWDRDYNSEMARLKNKGVAEGIGEETDIGKYALHYKVNDYLSLFGKNDGFKTQSDINDAMYTSYKLVDLGKELIKLYGNQNDPKFIELKDKWQKLFNNAMNRYQSQQGVAEDEIEEAKYQGREVPLGKPMKGDVKKSKVYVRGPKGNVVKVNFGDKNMRIKKSNPARRKSFRARHNCDNPGPRWKARYWSCKAW